MAAATWDSREGPSASEIGSVLGVDTQQHGDEVSLSSCPSCGESDGKLSKRSISYNATKKVFNCKKCGTTSGWMDLLRGFGVELTAFGGGSQRMQASATATAPSNGKAVSSFESAKSAISSLASNGVVTKGSKSGINTEHVRSDQLPSMMARYVERIQKPGSVVMHYLTKKRGFTFDTVRKWQLGETDAGDLVIPYLNERGGILGFKYRKLDTGRYFLIVKPDSVDFDLFGLQFFDTKSPMATVVEGELDAITLDQMGQGNVLSTANGKSSWKRRYAKILEPMQMVYIATDCEPDSEKIATQIQGDVGSHRSFRVIFWKEGFDGRYWKDANDALVKGGMTPDRCEKLFSNALINEGSYLDWLANVHRERRFLMAGFPHFDNEFGGFPVGELSFVVGDPGSGKTTFATAIMLNRARAMQSSLFISIDQPPDMIAGSVVSDIANVDYRDFLALPSERQVEMIRSAEFAHQHVWMVSDNPQRPFEGRMGWNLLRQSIERHVLDKGVDFVVIDNFMKLIGCWARDETDKRFRQDYQWLAGKVDDLTAFAHHLNCHIQVINHMKPGSSRSYSDLGQQYYQGMIQKDSGVVIEVRKVEDGDGNFRFVMATGTKVRYAKSQKKTPRVGFRKINGRVEELNIIPPQMLRDLENEGKPKSRSRAPAPHRGATA